MGAPNNLMVRGKEWALALSLLALAVAAVLSGALNTSDEPESVSGDAVVRFETPEPEPDPVPHAPHGDHSAAEAKLHLL